MNTGRRDGMAAASFLAPASLVVTLMLGAPLALMARYSLNRYSPTELMVDAVTPENFLRFFTDPFYGSVMRTTVGVAVSRTAACLLVGLAVAWRLAPQQ